MKTEGVYLSKSDAQTIFGIAEYNPVSLLKHWQSMISIENHSALFPEIKFMVVVVKTYLNYHSDDVKCIIKKLLNKVIIDIYKDKDEEATLPIVSLRFLFPVIWQHRNLIKYSQLKKQIYSEEMIAGFRGHLNSLKTLEFYLKA